MIPEIEKALWDGVSTDYPVTLDLMERCQKAGIENCVLSNALPALLESGKYQDWVKEKYRFYSFDLKMLKPNNDIYKEVVSRLNCSFDEVVFIDDKEKNIIAASDLGIYSILFTPETIENKMKEVFKSLDV